MTYIPRHAEKVVNELKEMFGAVLVTGPSQVGKTTMLSEIAKGAKYASLDDLFLQSQANENPNTFLKDFPPPVFIDEVQKAPNLFPYIKLHIDSSKKKGQFMLSGSQQFHMMKNVSESLAGRVGLVTLLGLSMRELTGSKCTKPFLPMPEYFKLRQNEKNELTYNDVWDLIVAGTMPAMHNSTNTKWNHFYAAYLKTYIERDVKELANVGNTVQFAKFMTAIAAMSGQLLNINSLAADVGISRKTAQQWLSVLVALNAVFLLQPYSNNLLKRAVKTPKVYFLDTGLACYLTKWNSAQTLKAGACAGAMFETFVVSEIVKSYYNAGVLDAPLYFYRNKEMAEVDLIIEADGMLYPIEIKRHADPSAKDIKNFAALEHSISGSELEVGQGCVVCMHEQLMHINENNWCVPVQMV